MVSKRKKSTKKVQGTDEPIVVLDETSTDVLTSEQEASVMIMTATDTVEEPKVQFVDETPKLLNLLNDSPKVPLIRTLEEATIFVDKYRVWKRDVRTATR